ncbi:MAG: pyrroline-5-carboxylate reductase [Pseudomonadota bacterium]|nr:pyrroline-5-carboxylate reductase [Pseudomonadota bacterium]
MNATICFIGAGNMAKSLIGGLIASGYSKDHIIATDPTEAQRNNITETFGIHCLEDNNTAIEQSDIIVLAVKPQILEHVCQNIQASTQAKKPLVISVAAGIRSADIDRWLGSNNAVVRTMPNTPALIQSGATGLFANQQVSDEQKNQAEHIMRAAGLTIWVKQETQLDAVTALSGSGPAYYFLFMEAMEDAAQKLGLDAKTAHLLTMQTALGAAKMVLESRDDCATLRKKVTSPKGTTEQAINTFEAEGIRDMVEKAMQAANNRAEELANELGGNA